MGHPIRLFYCLVELLILITHKQQQQKLAMKIKADSNICTASAGATTNVLTN